MTSMHFLWVYDYLLTLGDEVRLYLRLPRLLRGVLTATQINYAWPGEKSRGESHFVHFVQGTYNQYNSTTVFALFIAVRRHEMP